MSQITQETIVKMQPRGWLTIPARFRKDLNLDDGLVRIKKVGLTIIIEPVRTLPYSVRRYTDAEIEEFLEEDKKQSKELKKKKLI